jgi:hypothetical protein
MWFACDSRGCPMGVNVDAPPPDEFGVNPFVAPTPEAGG